MATPTLTNEKKVSSNDYICDDIAFSILSKLPIKSVKRFSCASKTWSLLFENPNFLNKFRNNIVSKPLPLYDDDDDDDACLLFKQTTPQTKLSFGLGQKAIILDLDLPSIFDVNYANPDIDILGSAINGIICFYDYDDHTNVILCNPYTQEIKFVPYTPTKFQLPEDTGAFFLHGFGYDHVHDDFKIIMYVDCDLLYDEYWEDDDMPDSSWEIYSLKSNSWKRLNVDNIPFLNDTPVGLEVYLDGICHWLGTKDEETYHVVSFNLSNEVFFTTPIDEYVPDCFKLAVINGSLAMIAMNDKTMSFNISIFGEIGVKESRITLFNVGPLSFSIKDVIAAGKKGNIYSSEKRSGKIACFDLTSGMIEEISLEEKSCIDQVVFYKKNPNRIEELINN